MGRTTGTEKLVAVGLIVLVAYFLWTSSGYPGGMPAAPIIVSPLPLQSFDIGQQIPVTWVYPGGLVVTSYRVQLGNQDFSNILSDTGKLGGNVTSTTITAPGVTGTQYIRVYYWDSKDVQSNPGKVQITITIATTPLFSILPDKSFSASWGGSFTLDFYNGASFDIEQIHIKLIDNIGVFYTFYVQGSDLYLQPVINRFNYGNLRFTEAPQTKLVAGDTQTFVCKVEVKSDAPAGIHTLVWQVTFISSDVGAPPSLEIPWKVTIYT